MRNLLLATIATVLVGTVAAQPNVVPVAIPAAARVPADKVHGLTMAFYDFPSWVPKGIDSLDDAKNFVASSKPTLTYVMNTGSISFPRDAGANVVHGDKISLGDYLLGKKEFARRLEQEKAKDAALWKRMAEPINQRSVFVFTGFVTVPKAGTFRMQIPVDDGDQVKIGGVVVHQKTDPGGMTGPDTPAYAAKVTFAEAGIYPIEVLHWDREHDLGIHVFSDLTPNGDIRDERVLLAIMKK